MDVRPYSDLHAVLASRAVWLDPSSAMLDAKQAARVAVRRRRALEERKSHTRTVLSHEPDARPKFAALKAELRGGGPETPAK